MWDRRTGQPLHHAIVWLDNRTAGLCHSMIEALGTADFFRPSALRCAALRCAEGTAAAAAAARAGAWPLLPLPTAAPLPALPRACLPHVPAVTGLPVSTYFSAFKLKWLLEHSPAVARAAAAGHAAFGTVDSWLLWNMTGPAGGAQWG